MKSSRSFKIQDIPGSAHKGEVVMLPPRSFKIQDIPGSAYKGEVAMLPPRSFKIQDIPGSSGCIMFLTFHIVLIVPRTDSVFEPGLHLLMPHFG